MLNAAQTRTYAKATATVHSAFGECAPSKSAHHTAKPAGASALTAAETIVARLAAEGKSNRDIADQIGRSDGVVKLHIKNAMRKCGMTSRTGFVRLFPPLAAQGDVDRIDLGTRETQVLALCADGRSNKQIGNELGITEATVKVYLKSVLAKLRLSNRTEAARWFIAHQTDGGV